MYTLINAAKYAIQQKDTLPFSIYSSIKEQHIFNVPIIKPLLIFVLDGRKELGQETPLNCPAGSFIFLSNSPNIDMRNIPDDKEYFALLIEFEYTDFDTLKPSKLKAETHFQGPIDSVLSNTLQQFIEWSVFAPKDLWSLRRQELLQLLYYLGYKQVSAVVESPSMAHRLHNLISADINNTLNATHMASMLAMSESTLRRRLAQEKTTIQTIKDQAKLGYGLHLIQTSTLSIGLIAEKCGYTSQSRFTDRFKQLFGITPTELRKTRMTD